VVLSVRSPTLSTSRRFKIELNPKISTDFGHLEGLAICFGRRVGAVQRRVRRAQADGTLSDGRDWI